MGGRFTAAGPTGSLRAGGIEYVVTVVGESAE
jgi:hypothetical protein